MIVRRLGFGVLPFGLGSSTPKLVVHEQGAAVRDSVRVRELLSEILETNLKQPCIARVDEEASTDRPFRLANQVNKSDDKSMSRRDKLHETVRRAIEKDGWTVTHDPFYVPFGATVAEIDLGAERLIAAERGTDKIAIETKSFVSPSVLSEFHTALGQYLNYRRALKVIEADRTLILAVPRHVFEIFFQQAIINEILTEFAVKVLVFDVQTERVSQWKN